MRKQHVNRLLAALLACLTLIGISPLDVLAEGLSISSDDIHVVVPAQGSGTEEEEEGAESEEEDGSDPGDEPGEEEDEEDEDVDLTYTVSFYVDDVLYHEETVDENTLVSLPENPPDEDAPFLGWYIDGEDILFSPYQIITSDLRLNARFSDNHIVTFYDTDGRELEVVELAPDEVVAEPTATPTLSMGKAVSYWYIEGDPDTPFVFGETTDTNLRLHPFISDRPLAVFITQSVEVEPQTGNPGFFAEDPQQRDPSLVMDREGYTFSHWAAAEDDVAPFDFDHTPIIGTVFIYAVWAPKSVPYMINFWCEKPGLDYTPDTPSNPDNLDDYELIYAKTMPSVPSGTVVHVSEATANANYPSGLTLVTNVLHYADYVWSETKTISGTGTTVVNVYYTSTLTEL